jgi:hypothetical protein
VSIFGKLFGNAKQAPAFAELLAIDPNAETLPDPVMTDRLRELITAPPHQRDDGWQHAFFSALWSAAIEVPTSAPFVGPDGFPYLRLDITPSDDYVAHNLASLARPCLDAGSGAVLYADPTAEQPAYVIPMGVIESLVRYRDWRGEPSELAETNGDPQSGNVTIKAGTKILHSTPSADYLSPQAARALDGHLKEIWHVPEPRVLLMSSMAMQPCRSLVINVSRSAFKSDEYAQNFGRSVCWFMPPSRSITFMPDDMNEAEMTPLADLAKN